MSSTNVSMSHVTLHDKNYHPCQNVYQIISQDNFRSCSPLHACLRMSRIFIGYLLQRDTSIRHLWLDFQTRTRWTEVKSVQMTESRLAGVQKVFCVEGPRVSLESLAPGQTRFAPVQPHVAPVRPAFCSYVLKDLLRSLQSILGQIS